jgi:hypothetical protein
VDFTGLRQVVNKSRQVCWFRQTVTGLREQVGRKLVTICVYIVCSILKKNMQVGCHISVVLKDQLILKIVYEKNLSLICPIFSAILLKIISQVCL